MRAVKRMRRQLPGWRVRSGGREGRAGGREDKDEKIVTQMIYRHSDAREGEGRGKEGGREGGREGILPGLYWKRRTTRMRAMMLHSGVHLHRWYTLSKNSATSSEPMS